MGKQKKIKNSIKNPRLSLIVQRAVKLTACVITSLVVVGCKEEEVKIKGNLEIGLPTSFKNVDANARDTILQPGQYSTILGFKSRREVEMQIKTNKKTLVASIKIPAGQKFPTENGVIALSAKDIGQGFDLMGQVRTEVTKGQVVRDHQSCTWTRTTPNCFPVGNPPQMVCQDRQETQWGQQVVEYRNDKKHREITFQIQTPGTEEVRGHFESIKDWTEKVVLYEGRCM